MARLLILVTLLSLTLFCLAHEGSHNNGKVMDSPHRTRQQRKCRLKLKYARKQLKCALLRISLPLRMDRARNCIYNGLDWSEYRDTRVICKNRSESLTRVRAAKNKCRKMGVTVRWEKPMEEEEEEEEEEPVDVSGITCGDYDSLLKARKRAVRACIKIGWTGDKRKCADLEMMKHKMWYIMKKGCGEGGMKKWRRTVRIKEMRCGGAKGVVKPLPSSPPRRW